MATFPTGVLKSRPAAGALRALDAIGRLATGVLALALLSGCGAGFDRVSEVKTLRVLGVQKDKPYPSPGDTVSVKMLWHDALRDEDDRARDVQVSWFPPCFNPIGNLYYSCFPEFARPDILDVLTHDNTASIVIPENIVETAGAAPPDQPRYGLTFVFFALCAGTLGFYVPEQPEALPIACRDGSGNMLASDSFVVGYTTLYTFAEGFQNGNPSIDGFEVAGAQLSTVCTASDVDCQASMEGESVEEIDCDSTPALCIPACEDDGDPSCPDIDLHPLIQRSVAESDDVSRVYYGRDIGEQMWIDYYASRGNVKSDVRLLNDATAGFNEDYGTKYFAPKDTGDVYIWAVSHDNRGGSGWARARLKVQ